MNRFRVNNKYNRDLSEGGRVYKIKKDVFAIFAINIMMNMFMISNIVLAAENQNQEEKSLVQYSDQEVTSITLPTDEAFNTPFIIDPQGSLSIIKDGDTVKEEAKGTIVPQTIASIKNVSSYPVDVMMDLYVTKDLETGDSSSVLLDDNNEGLDSSTENKLFLNIYATGNITDDELSVLRSYRRDYELIKKNEFIHTINIDANGRNNAMEISFLLKEANYKIDGNEMESAWDLDETISDNYSQVAFCIGGEVSEKADWGHYTGRNGEAIAIKAIFTIRKSSHTVSDKVTINAFDATAPEYFNNTSIYDNIVLDSDRIDAVLSSELDLNQWENFEIPVDFGKGSRRVNVTNVCITKDDEKLFLQEGVDYDVAYTGLILKVSSPILQDLKYSSKYVLSFVCGDAFGNEKQLNVSFYTKNNDIDIIEDDEKEDDIYEDITKKINNETGQTYLGNPDLYDYPDEKDMTTAMLQTAYVIEETEGDFIIPVNFGNNDGKGMVTDVSLIQGEEESLLLLEGIDYYITEAGIVLRPESEALWCFRQPAENILSFVCTDIVGSETRLNVIFNTIF